MVQCASEFTRPVQPRWGGEAMANIKSARKRDLSSEKRRLHNTIIKSRIRTAIRRFDEALAANESEQVEQRLDNAFSIIDKAAAKGVIHKNKAAHQKAQLSRKLNAMTQAAAE